MGEEDGCMWVKLGMSMGMGAIKGTSRSRSVRRKFSVGCVPKVDCRPCGGSWSGRRGWELGRPRWEQQEVSGSAVDHLRMRWVRLRFGWDQGEDAVASLVGLAVLWESIVS